MNDLMVIPQTRRSGLKTIAPGKLLRVAIATTLLTMTLATSALAQERERMLRTLTVTGRGNEMIATSLSQVRLGVEAQGKTANEAQQEAARRSNAVVNLLRSRNVDKLETTSINLNPIYRYDNGRQTITGYAATNIVSFRLETSRVGGLLDDVVKAGATRIDGISFIASDEAIASARKVALREATQDAQEQADAVLSTLGLTRQQIVNIQIGNAFVPPPRPIEGFAMDLKAASAPAPTPVIGGEQQVEATVTLQISY